MGGKKNYPYTNMFAVDILKYHVMVVITGPYQLVCVQATVHSLFK